MINLKILIQGNDLTHVIAALDEIKEEFASGQLPGSVTSATETRHYMAVTWINGTQEPDPADISVPRGT